MAKLQRELNSAKKALEATKAELKESKKTIKNMQKENGFSEMATVFIDGSAGTTGLRIHERLQERTDIQVPD